MDDNQPSQQAYIALVCSILGCMGCGGCITGIIGAILGKMELDKIQRGESAEAGANIAKAAIGLGIAEVVVVGLLMIAYFGMIFLGVGVGILSEL